MFSLKFKPVFLTLLFLSLCLFSTGAAKSKSEEVPAEYKELFAIVEAEKTLQKRMESDVPEEKMDKEIQLRLQEIDQSYREYIDKYPRSVFGQILYGKFLRKANRPQDAYSIFLDIHEDNPDIAVVNQHLALFASEIGDFEDGLKYWEKAIQLEPDVALYYYQFGEYLYTYKIPLVKRHYLPISEVEDKMLFCFQKAHELQPENRDFHVRYAETYFDVFEPDWNLVLKIWDELLDTSNNLFERDVMRLQKVRVLLELERYYNASELLKTVSDPALMDTKSALMEKLP